MAASSRNADALDLDTVARLRTAVARLARLLRQQDQSGFGPTLTAALFTIATDGPMTLGDLAAKEQVAPPTITKVVDKLETHGLVERQFDSTDRRVRHVAVTAAGRRHLDQSRTRRTQWLAERLAELSPDDRERLTGALEVLEKLTQAPDPDASSADGGARRP